MISTARDRTPPASPRTTPHAVRLVLIGVAACALLATSSRAASPPVAAAAAVSAVAAAPARAVGASLERLYGDAPSQLLWSDPRQAEAALALLRAADRHGLDPAHYDAEALALRHASLAAHDAGAFDRALSQAMLVFLGDLHFGRVKPDFQWSPADQQAQQFDVAAHLRQALAQQRLPQAVDSAAPALPLYQRVQAMLLHYRQLASEAPAWSAPVLPADGKLAVGKTYPGLGLLAQRLVLLGDLDAASADASPGIGQDQLDAPLAAALKRFQARHGLAETGTPGRATIAALGVPLAQRVRQLELTLERLRWMPRARQGRMIVVNIAAYRLWAFDTAAANGEALEMRVIVGKAVRTPTPLFIGQMRYLEFNPYWNVPRSIAVGEIAGKLARNSAYLAQNQMELVSPAGKVQPATAEAAAALRSGALRVRQRPGPQNVLGAVKFAMPNPMNIYLHSTSARQLFGQARRDLSHGCIRVERPQELASFVLGDQPAWSADQVAAAMAPGATRTVQLSKPIPVVLFYATAVVDRAGRALFADDIYRRDAKLDQLLKAR